MSADNNPDITPKPMDMTDEKLRDAAIPGFLAECDPDEAEAMGAFKEVALTLDDALEGAFEFGDSSTEESHNG